MKQTHKLAVVMFKQMQYTHKVTSPSYYCLLNNNLSAVLFAKDK